MKFTKGSPHALVLAPTWESIDTVEAEDWAPKTKFSGKSLLCSLFLFCQPKSDDNEEEEIPSSTSCTPAKSVRFEGIDEIFENEIILDSSPSMVDSEHVIGIAENHEASGAAKDSCDCVEEQIPGSSQEIVENSHGEKPENAEDICETRGSVCVGATGVMLAKDLIDKAALPSQRLLKNLAEKVWQFVVMYTFFALYNVGVRAFNTERPPRIKGATKKSHNFD